MKKTELTKQYIDLLKSSLLNDLYIENEAKLVYTFIGMLNKRDLDFYDYLNAPERMATLINRIRDAKLVGDTLILQKHSTDGISSPAPELRNVIELSHTMIGRRRMENLQYCIETV